MARRAPTWTCQRQTDGVKCRAINASRKQICVKCGKRRPPRKQADHLVALELTYDEYVVLNGGNHCGVCYRTPEDLGKRVLDRDHDHRPPYAPRGLLCRQHNRRLLAAFADEEILAAAEYVRRYQERMRTYGHPA